MKFSAAAVLAVAAGASAWQNASVTYTTEVLTAVTTYCPEATQITYGGQTYTVTEATTLTISDCPCTISKPLTIATSVSCSTCTDSAGPTYYNTTGPAPTTAATAKTSAVGTTSRTVTASTTGATSVPTAGAGKAAALSGAGLAGVIGMVAFLL